MKICLYETLWYTKFIEDDEDDDIVCTFKIDELTAGLWSGESTASGLRSASWT